MRRATAAGCPYAELADAPDQRGERGQAGDATRRRRQRDNQGTRMWTLIVDGVILAFIVSLAIAPHEHWPP
jgi:hypothetical protein